VTSSKKTALPLLGLKEVTSYSITHDIHDETVHYKDAVSVADKDKSFFCKHAKEINSKTTTGRLVTTAIPAQSKKIQTSDRTSEAYFATLVKLLGIIVSRQYSKSSDVGIYRAGTLLPDIIVTPFTQNCTFRTVMYVSYVFLSISHSATVDRNQLV